MIMEEKPKRDFKNILKDFFIPRNFIDVIFIIICIIVALYAVTYDIPRSLEATVCLKHFEKWYCPCALNPFYNNSSITGILNSTISNVSFP
jgi:hypothetical protein